MSEKNNENITQNINSEQKENHNEPKVANQEEYLEQCLAMIAQKDQQIADLQDKIVRSAAELDNMRKRYEKRIDETAEFAIASFAKDLIAITDNLNRALEHSASENTEVKNIPQGVEMIFGQFMDVLKKHHVEIIETKVGDNFDHNHHHAIAQVPTTEYKKGSVVNVMQIGYKLKDRLLRPSSVAIAIEPQ